MGEGNVGRREGGEEGIGGEGNGEGNVGRRGRKGEGG